MRNYAVIMLIGLVFSAVFAIKAASVRIQPRNIDAEIQRALGQ